MKKSRRTRKVPRSFDLDPSRVLMIAGVIDWDTVKEVGFILAQYGDSPLPILVRIGSPGGKLVAGMAVYDMLRTSPAPIITEAVGMAGSAAAIIHQAGHVRLVAPHARILIHCGSLEIENASVDVDDARTMSKEIAERDRAIAGLLAKRTGNKVKDVKAWMDDSKVFSAREALRCGFADGMSQHTSAAEVMSTAARFLAALEAAHAASPPSSDE